jgi:hypothetical protein
MTTSAEEKYSGWSICGFRIHITRGATIGDNYKTLCGIYIDVERHTFFDLKSKNWGPYRECLRCRKVRQTIEKGCGL